MTDSLEVSLARLEGKVDKIDVKLDANKELLLDRIEAGDKESMQAIRFVEERVGGLEKLGEGRDRRLDHLEEKAEKSGDFQARLIGMAVILTILVGVASAALTKALGL